MDFRVLGPVEVAAGGQRARLASGRQRAMLAVLLAAGGETVSSGRLAEAVWEGSPPPSARKTLQSHLSRLRAELGRLADEAPPLASAVDGYRIDVAAHRLDAARFTQLVTRSHEVVAHDPSSAIALLDEALALWRGPAFGELASTPGVRDDAMRLEALRAQARADRVDACLALGRYEHVAAELEATVSRRPLDERAHGQLMTAWYGMGRQADALTTYRRLQDRLREEVGADPSPALRALHQRILQQDERLATPAAGGGRHPSADGRVPGSTPTGTGRALVHAGDLVGREATVADVVSQVPRARVVTLTGPGGVGKTRLAEQVAARVAGDFDDGVVLCALAGIRDPQAVGDALVTSLGIQPTRGGTAVETLLSALGERRLLLVLDNCEHVLAAVAPLVDAIVGRCPAVGVLATSRERLHLSSERVCQVPPLAVPARDASAEDVAATPAGALFMVRARAAEPTFTLTDANAAAVAELCRRLDGMPLAIELAAARIRALSPQDLAARLDRRFALLAGGPRHEAGRHRTLQSVVAWSYDLLDPSEATFFDRLSVFAGSFSLDAAERVTAGDGLEETEVAGLLGELVDKSMVIVERGATMRYRLLDTLREYGARRLHDTGGTRTRRIAHAAHHLDLAETCGPLIHGPDERDAVAAIDAAFDDLRAAHAWMVATGDTVGALRLPAALVDHGFYRLRDEITSWARRGLEMPDAAAHREYAAALATAAQGATSRDECPRAHREGTAALAHAGTEGPAAASALGALGTAALYEGRLDDVVDCARRLSGVADVLDDDFHRSFAGVLRVLGHVYRGDQDAATDAVAGLQQTAEASGSPTMRAFAHYCRGEVGLDTHPADAATSFERAVALARDVDNALIEGVSLVSLASLRGRRHETEVALQLFREVIVHWRRLGDHTHQLTTVRNLVELLTQIGADPQAAVLYGAVTRGGAPTFGAEAERLTRAWQRLERRIGARAATAAAERGRTFTATQMGDHAVSVIDALVAD